MIFLNIFSTSIYNSYISYIRIIQKNLVLINQSSSSSLSSKKLLIADLNSRVTSNGQSSK